MSTRRGNVGRDRPQKHQNRTAFKNDLHDTSCRTKFIKSIRATGVCARCKDIIDWKIKYKKYKPLTAPATCVRCAQRNVRHAYHVMCGECARNENACAKCCKKSEIIEKNEDTTPAQDEEFKQILKALPERKRRTLLRYLNKKKEKSSANGEGQDESENCSDDLTKKIDKLKIEAMNNKDDDGESYDELDSDFDSESFSDEET